MIYAPYLYMHCPNIRVALSGQEEVPRDAFRDLEHGRMGCSSGSGRCTQLGGLIVDIRRPGRHGAVPVFIVLLLLLVEKFSCKRESDQYCI